VIPSALEELVHADVGVTEVSQDRWGSWALLRMPGFAGPQSDWRAMPLADDVGAVGVRRGDTHEATTQTYRWHRIVVDVDVDTPRQREMGIEPSAAGASLTEILGETRRQHATIDASISAYLIGALAITPASMEDVLVSFDGVVHTRRSLGWQPARTTPPPSWEYRASDHERARALVHLISGLGIRSTKRSDNDVHVVATSNALASELDRVARVRSDVEWAQWRADVTRLHDALMSALTAHAPAADARAAATIVRALFAERWHNEQRVLEAVLG
jgi:hypothetical protein